MRAATSPVINNVGRHVLAAVLFLFFSVFTFSQPISYKSFLVNEEGATPRILSLLHYSKGGFIVGTSEGIFRFDGLRFTPIPFADKVPLNAVTSLAEDNDGNIWLGLQNGMIATSNLKNVSLLQAEEGHPNATISAIAIDTVGTIFFATAGEGIYYYRNKRFYNINTDDGLSDNYVYQLMFHAAGLLAATDRGINTINLINNKKVVSHFTTANGLPDNIVRSLYSNTNNYNNGCWIGMQDNGIGKYQPSENLFFSADLLKPWKYGQINSMIAQQQQLWVATEDQGLVAVHFADSSFQNPTSLNVTNGFSKAANLTEDNEGNIWFTSSLKLIRTPGAQLQLVIPLTQQELAEAHTILSDSKQNIWINQNTGLHRFSYNVQQGKWVTKVFPLPNINIQTDITSIYEDVHGNIWIGTMGKGVFIINPATGKSRNLTEDNLLVDGSVLSIDGKGQQVWISSLGGAVLCKLTDENKDISQRYNFEDYNRVSGIGSNYIYSILLDSKNRVWFATDGKGITVLDKGKYTNFNEKNGIKSKVIYSICEDPLGNIWFSTLGDGMYVFNGSSFKNINVENGLNDATITALSIDGKGNIIAISKKGINIIDAKTRAISYLDDNQGITEINTDLNCISNNNGNVYFLSDKGIIRFAASYKTLQPPINLNQVKLFDSTINTNDEKVFSHDENNFTFFFTSISLSHPDKIRYQVKLDGFATDWTNTKDNHINFPRLPAGKYTFRVRTSLNNSFDANNEATYSFKIREPFWFQWWFVLLVQVVISALLYWFIKSRETRLKRWERLEKEKIQSQFETLKSQVNPHFLFNSFNTLISVIEENPDQAVEYVEHLSDLYRKIVTYRDKDTITLSEELQLIYDYFLIQQKRFGNNLQLIIKIPKQQQEQYKIAPLTLQLLCENAVKHNAISANTPLLISICIEDDLLVVKNNIIPKYSVEKGAGMGLQNIRKRYALLSRKEIKIEQVDSHFVVHIPLL